MLHHQQALSHFVENRKITLYSTMARLWFMCSYKYR